MRKLFIKVNDSSAMVYTLLHHLQRIDLQTTMNCLLSVACRVPFSQKDCLCRVSLKGQWFYESIISFTYSRQMINQFLAIPFKKNKQQDVDL